MNNLLSISQKYHNLDNQHKKHYLHYQNDSFTWETSKNSTTAAVDQLRQEIGEIRFDKICARQKISKRQLKKLSDATVEKIFVGIGDVRKEDLVDLCQSQGKSLPEKIKKIDRHYDTLLFSMKPKQIFFRHKPTLLQDDTHDSVYGAGKGYKGQRERVWIILKYRQKCLKTSLPNISQDQIEDVEFLTSRLIDREPPTDIVVRLRKGNYFNDKIIAKRGAYVNFFKSFDSAQTTLINCRGSTAHLKATTSLFTLVNDLQPELANIGVRRVWNQVQTYLEAEQIKEVEIAGKSMGGSVAQAFTVLILGKTSCGVKNLTTYCSPGTPDAIQEIYDGIQKEKPKIQIIRNARDYIHFVGGAHLRNQNDDDNEICYIAPKNDEAILDHNMRDQNYFVKAKHLFKSFFTGHINQITLDDYVIHEIQNKDKAYELEAGKTLETSRKVVAWILNVGSLGIFYKKFKKFYKKTAGLVDSHSE